ncbi:Nn.00g026500.m01.CDS01 [Neocucurbitaria sp. VM-36]
MYKIFLDGSQAESTRMQEGDYKGFDWHKWDKAAFANWQILIQNWVNYCGDDNRNILGLVAQLDSTVGTPATFPPIWLSRQTYPFLDPSVSNPQAQRNHSFNALVYLMMSDKNAPVPSPALLSPAASGNWLVPNDNLNGTYCLSRELFWDRYLLPKLYNFCSKVCLHVQTPGVSVEGFMNIEYSEDWKWTVGAGMPPTSDKSYPTDKFYTGPLKSDLPDDQKPSSGPAKYHIGMVWETPGDGDQKVGDNLPNGLFRVIAHNSSWQWFTVNYTPGSNIIELEGRSRIDAKADYKGSDTPAWPTWESAWFKVSWKLTLEVASIEGGGVTINVRDMGPNDMTVDKGSDGHTLKGTIIPYYLQQQAESYHTTLKANFDNSFSWFQNVLKDSLKDQGRLFLPGNGALLFNNATFNNEGDLLTEVKFDGTGL